MTKRVFAILPHAGLANRLLAWALAYRCAHELNAPLSIYGWGRIHIGPWLRGERTKRYYATSFRKQHGWWDFCEYWLAKRRGECLINPDLARLDDCRQSPYLAFTQCPDPPDYFANLRGHQDLIRRGLMEMLREPLVRKAESLERPFLALHVRRGDNNLGHFFMAPEDYYVSVVLGVRKVLGDSYPAMVFTDGYPHEIPNLLALPHVRLATVQADILDLIQMSRATIIASSPRSTFSYFAGFLSDAHLIHHPKYKDGPMHDASRRSQLFEGTLAEFTQQAPQILAQPSSTQPSSTQPSSTA